MMEDMPRLLQHTYRNRYTYRVGGDAHGSQDVEQVVCHTNEIIHDQRQTNDESYQCLHTAAGLLPLILRGS